MIFSAVLIARILIKTVGAVAATAFTAVTTLKVILFGKAAVAFGSEVIVSFFWFEDFFEMDHIPKIAFYGKNINLRPPFALRSFQQTFA